MLWTDVSHIIFIKYISNLNIINEEGNLTTNSKIHNKTIQVPRLVVDPELKQITRLRERNKELKTKLESKYRHITQLETRIAQLEGMLLISQSGSLSDSQPPPGIREEVVAPMSSEQITSFADQDAGWTTNKVGFYEPTMDLSRTSDSDLGNFLKRPIRESAQSWLVGQPFFYKFNPWTKFCENSFVSDKIKNYQLLRMKLHVKVVISGTKFHYGRALVAYNPYIVGDRLTRQRAFIPQDLIQASQKPHFFLNPTKNTGGQLDLPFFWPENYLDIPNKDWRDMGEITISSFSNLLHANGGDDPVTVTIYIWAEDIVLTVPTSSEPLLTSQSGMRGNRSSSLDTRSITSNDEYGQGIISKPASALAKAAGALTRVPLIGPYMRATEIGAKATSEVAQMFGYSRPNIISEVQQIKPIPTGNLANTDASDGALKLTLDSKAELTVDSRTVGLDGSDEMGILDYVKRESYLTNFIWSPGLNPDALLWNTRVLPMQLDIVTSTTNEIHMTPLAHMATAFEVWQGSIKFRFQIVKSDFHKGRILVRWDPNNVDSSVEYNVNYSRVIDIAETDDFEIVVGWGQREPWLPCDKPDASSNNFSSTQRLPSSPLSNGILELTVLNDLVCPSIDAPISVNVFVSACDDFKLAAPRGEVLSQFHLFDVPLPEQRTSDSRLKDSPRGVDEILESQSSTPNVETGDTTISDKPTSPSEMDNIIGKSQQNDATYLVYYGDPPCSIRELCKRYTYTRFWWPPAANNNSISINTLLNKNMPYHTGYDVDGIDDSTLDGNVTVGSTAFSSWFAPSFAGVRGSYRKKYFFTAGDAGQTPVVVRGGYNEGENGKITARNALLGADPRLLQKTISSRWNQLTGNGAVATNLGINNTIEVEFPYYQPKRFSSSRIVKAQELDCNSHTVTTVSSELGTQQLLYNVPYQQYDAVGEDWSLFFFTGVPIYYQYALTENS